MRILNRVVSNAAETGAFDPVTSFFDGEDEQGNQLEDYAERAMAEDREAKININLFDKKTRIQIKQEELGLELELEQDSPVTGNIKKSRLHLAVEAGDIGSTIRFLAEGDNLYARDCNGETALDIAIGEEHEDIVELLMALQRIE
ncbi:MAG: hypothetical protein CMB80_00865 [Flammeovirgaceae bacterium]|nr:hypothetical protein [Flammeovirgaceae bacterium]